MHSSSARRAITGRVSTAERGTCPICGKSMRMELLAEHADLCASKLEEGGSYGGSSGVGGGMARRTHKKRLPNQRPPAASSSSHGKRPAAAGSSRALYVNAAPAPLTSPASAEASDAHPDLYLVDSVHVEGFEFRCQSLRALDKGKRELGSAPSPVGGPQALAAAKSDAADGGGDSPRWRASAASSSSSNLLPGPVACAAPLGAPPVAHDDPLASEADDFLNAVRLAFANAPKRQEKFMDVMLGFQSGTIDTVEVMEQVASLLSAHAELLQKFNRFLPDGYRIEPLPSTLSSYGACHGGATPRHEDATTLAYQFIDRVVARFQDDPQKLTQLHAILAASSLSETHGQPATGDKPPPGLVQLYQELRPLINSDPQLAREFIEYIPGSCHSTGHIHTILPAPAPPQQP